MTYVPADDRYDRMPYHRCGRSGLLLPAISLGLWQNFGGDRAARDAAARSCAAPSTSASPTSTSPTTTARRTAPRRRTSGGSCATDLAPYRDELVDLDQGGLRHVARARTATGARASTCWRASTRASAHGPRLRRHLLLAPARPRDAARGDDGRARHAPSARARRCTSASRRTRPEHTARGGRRSCASSARRCLIHQPSYSMLNRWIEGGPARRPRRGGRRLHRVLAARPGDAHRPLPGRHPGGLAGQPQRLALARACSPRRTLDKVRALNEIAAAARSDARADGDRVGAARPARHLGARRRQQRRAARGQRRRPRPASTSPPTSSPRSTGTRPTAASTSGRGRATNEQRCTHRLRPARHPRAILLAGMAGRPEHPRAGRAR